MASVGYDTATRTRYESRGRATAALVAAVLLLCAFAAVPIVGAYGFARDYGAGVPVSLLAGAAVAGALSIVWLLGRSTR
jgi:hypothetical protein